MNILYLCTDPGIDLSAQSGNSIHILSFVRALADLGHSIAIVGNTLKSGESTAADLAAVLHASPLSRRNRSLARAMQRLNRLAGAKVREHPDVVRILHNLAFSRVASVAARQAPPDFIYERYSLWGVSGLKLAKRRGVPLVLEVNAPLVYEQQLYRGLSFPALARSIERRVWRRADLIFAVSESLRSQLQSAGVAPDRVCVLPNAVDTSLFRSDSDGESVRKRFKLGNLFVIGFIGTFKPWHGAELLLDAFQHLYHAHSSTHLLLVGDGPLRPALERAVHESGLTSAVTFTGTVAHPQMPHYLAAMDVAVAPYPALDQFYYSPLKLYEYMAAGRAIIASRVGQITEVIRDGSTGLLFKPGDRSDLLNCLRRLQQDRRLRGELGGRAASACREHTWSRNAQQVINRIEMVLQGRRRASSIWSGQQSHA